MSRIIGVNGITINPDMQAYIDTAMSRNEHLSHLSLASNTQSRQNQDELYLLLSNDCRLGTLNVTSTRILLIIICFLLYLNFAYQIILDY